MKKLIVSAWCVGVLAACGGNNDTKSSAPVATPEAVENPALISGIEEIRFEFFQQGKWQTVLDNTHLPLAVAIELQTEDMGEIRRQFLVAGDLFQTLVGVRIAVSLPVLICVWNGGSESPFHFAPSR